MLKNDAKKGLDGQAWFQFWSTLLVAAPAAASGAVGTDTKAIVLSTNGTTTMTNSVNLHKGHINSIVVTMKERNIPPYMGDEYFGIAWPATSRRRLPDDLQRRDREV